MEKRGCVNGVNNYQYLLAGLLFSLMFLLVEVFIIHSSKTSLVIRRPRPADPWIEVCTGVGSNDQYKALALYIPQNKVEKSSLSGPIPGLCGKTCIAMLFRKFRGMDLLGEMTELWQSRQN